jgi:hypothetical protein
MARFRRLPSRLVVAGLARHSGQKIHNLLAATESLSDRVEALAFVDADARPRPDWLRWLMIRIRVRNGRHAATTGYRWLIPRRRTLPNLLLYSVNSGVAALFGNHKHIVVWGGSWGMLRETFDTLNVRGAWQGTLSDDLVASRVLRQAGKSALFEPGCLCPSPADMNWRQLLEFLRRQSLICRRYTPLHWWLGLLYLTVLQLGFWSTTVSAVLLWQAGRAEWLGFAALGVLLYVLAVVRGMLRQSAARLCLPQLASELAAASWFDTFLSPLSGLFAWLLMLLSCVGQCIEWRGVRYRIRRGGQIDLLSRRFTPRLVETPALCDQSNDKHLRRAA